MAVPFFCSRILLAVHTLRVVYIRMRGHTNPDEHGNCSCADLGDTCDLVEAPWICPRDSKCACQLGAQEGRADAL